MVEQRQSCENRVQFLMDHLVNLLSRGANSEGNEALLREIHADGEERDRLSRQRLELFSRQLEEARQENRANAQRLSDMQCATTAKHEQLCLLQNRIFNGLQGQPQAQDADGAEAFTLPAATGPLRGGAVAAAAAMAAVEARVSAGRADLWVNGRAGTRMNGRLSPGTAASGELSALSPTLPDLPAGGSEALERARLHQAAARELPEERDAASGRTAPRRSCRGEAKALPVVPSSNGGYEASLATLERKLHDALVTASFESPVVRIGGGQGHYRFGSDTRAVVSLTPDGELMASKEGDMRSEPIQSFLKGLSAGLSAAATLAAAESPEALEAAVAAAARTFSPEVAPPRVVTRSARGNSPEVTSSLSWPNSPDILAAAPALAPVLAPSAAVAPSPPVAMPPSAPSSGAGTPGSGLPPLPPRAGSPSPLLGPASPTLGPAGGSPPTSPPPGSPTLGGAVTTSSAAAPGPAPCTTLEAARRRHSGPRAGWGPAPSRSGTSSPTAAVRVVTASTRQHALGMREAGSIEVPVRGSSPSSVPNSATLRGGFLSHSQSVGGAPVAAPGPAPRAQVPRTRDPRAARGVSRGRQADSSAQQVRQADSAPLPMRRPPLVRRVSLAPSPAKVAATGTASPREGAASATAATPRALSAPPDATPSTLLGADGSQQVSSGGVVGSPARLSPGPRVHSPPPGPSSRVGSQSGSVSVTAPDAAGATRSSASGSGGPGSGRYSATSSAGPSPRGARPGAAGSACSGGATLSPPGRRPAAGTPQLAVPASRCPASSGGAGPVLACRGGGWSQQGASPGPLLVRTSAAGNWGSGVYGCDGHAASVSPPRVTTIPMGSAGASAVGAPLAVTAAAPAAVVVGRVGHTSSSHSPGRLSMMPLTAVSPG